MHFLSYLRVALVGFLMGCADVVPGVSGGTIAFICGIYTRLLDGIKSFDLTTLRLVLARDFKGAWARVPVLFFVALGTGLILAILTMARVLSHLLATQPVLLWSFFFGLVLGSILLLARQTWVWKPADWAVFAVAAVATFLLVGSGAVQTPAGLPFLFVSGAIAICAMILPGISGSYLLVIMGQYGIVLDAVNGMSSLLKLVLKGDLAGLREAFTWTPLLQLTVFLSGIVVGILSFVRVVSWLLHHHRHVTLIALTGIMAGALRTLWPWKETLTTRIDSSGEVVPVLQTNVVPGADGQIGLALVLLVVGGLTVLLIERIARAEQRETKSSTA
jgi:putative membrane protein